MNENTQAIKDRAAIELLKHMVKTSIALDKGAISVMDLNNVIVVAEGKAIDPKTFREVEVIT